MILINQTKHTLFKLRFLFRPMFFLSLMFHIWFLSLPLPSSSELDEKKAEEKDIEEKVKITRLTPPSPKPSPTPNAKLTPPQVQSPPEIKSPAKVPKITPDRQPIARVPSPSPTPKLTPTPRNSPVTQNTPDPQQSTPKPSPTNTPSPSPTSSPTPPLTEENTNNSEVASAAGASLLEELRPRILKRLEQSTNDLDAMENYIDTLPTQFIKDEEMPFFLTGEKQLKSGTFGYLTIPQTSPYGAYFEYIEPVVKNELGFDITQLEEDYGDSLLYEAKNSSNVSFYMSIVKLKGSGAWLVLWADNPNESQ